MNRYLLATLFSIGCTAHADDRVAPTHAPGPGTVTLEIGPAGGVIELADGPRLEIAAGALAAERTFSITRLGEQYPVGALSVAYTFSPRDVVFAKPATVSFPLPDGLRDVDIYWLVNGGTHHDRLGARAEHRALHGSVVRLGTAYLAPRAGGRAVWGVGKKTGQILAVGAVHRAPCDVSEYPDGTYLVRNVADGDDVVEVEAVSATAPAAQPPRC